MDGFILKYESKYTQKKFRDVADEWLIFKLVGHWAANCSTH